MSNELTQTFKDAAEQEQKSGVTAGFVNYPAQMSYREWLIGQALAGLMANPNTSAVSLPDFRAKSIVKMVDAVIEEMNKPAGEK